MVFYHVHLFRRHLHVHLDFWLPPGFRDHGRRLVR
jgi:hypothetical protein